MPDTSGADAVGTHARPAHASSTQAITSAASRAAPWATRHGAAGLH